MRHDETQWPAVFEFQLLGSEPVGKQILGPAEVCHGKIRRKTVLGIDNHMRCVRGDTRFLEEMCDWYPFPLGVEFRPLRHTMDIGNELAGLEAQNIFVGEPQRVVDEPIYREIPLVDVDPRHRTGMEHRKSISDILSWWKPGRVETASSHFGRLLVEESHRHEPTDSKRMRRRLACMIRFTGLFVARMAACLLLLAGCGAGFEAYPAPEVRAPFLDAPGEFDLQGNLEVDGRPVLLNLWASWCAPCKAEMPALDEASRQRPDVAFVGIAVLDRESEAREFLEEVPVSFPIALDRDGSVAELLGINGLPVTLIIDTAGMVIDEHRGPLDLDAISDLLPKPS